MVTETWLSMLDQVCRRQRFVHAKFLLTQQEDGHKKMNIFQKFNLFNKEYAKKLIRDKGESKIKRNFRDKISRIRNLKEFARYTFDKMHKIQEYCKSFSSKSLFS